MIIARSAGRLGNQLFVIAAIRKVTGTDESLVLVGFEDLVQTFPEILRGSRHIPLPRQHWWRWNLVENILTFLGTLRVVSIITAHPTERRLVKQRGLIPLALFRGGWCQDEHLIDPAISQALLESLTRDSVQAENSKTLSLPATQCVQALLERVCALQVPVEPVGEVGVDSGDLTHSAVLIAGPET